MRGTPSVRLPLQKNSDWWRRGLSVPQDCWLRLQCQITPLGLSDKPVKTTERFPSGARRLLSPASPSMLARERGRGMERLQYFRGEDFADKASCIWGDQVMVKPRPCEHSVELRGVELAMR